MSRNTKHDQDVVLYYGQVSGVWSPSSEFRVQITGDNAAAAVVVGDGKKRRSSSTKNTKNAKKEKFDRVIADLASPHRDVVKRALSLLFKLCNANEDEDDRRRWTSELRKVAGIDDLVEIAFHTYEGDEEIQSLARIVGGTILGTLLYCCTHKEFSSFLCELLYLDRSIDKQSYRLTIANVVIDE